MADIVKRCPVCGKGKNVSARWVYRCKKCGDTGCWASGPAGGLIEHESCLSTKCRMGGDHDKIAIAIVKD